MVSINAALLGSDFTLSTPALLKVLQQQHVSPIMFDQRPNLNEDNTIGIQRTIDAGQEDGKPVILDAGIWNIEDKVILDNSASASYLDPSKIDILGAGMNSTRVVCQGVDAGLKIIGGTVAGTNPFQSFQRIGGFTLIGTGETDSVGLILDTTQHIIVDAMQLASFDLGLEGIDVDFASFRKLKLYYNRRGNLMYERFPRETYSTRPNGIDFQGCQWGGNTLYAGTWIGGAEVSIVYGDVEDNGSAEGYCFLFEDMGIQGGVGANVQNVYFENNMGPADIWINNQNAPPPGFDPRLAVHNILNNSFTRRTSDHFTETNILCSFNEAVAGRQLVNIQGNGFKGYNSYVPDAGREYIQFSVDAMQQGVNCRIQGNIQKDAVETVPQIDDDVTDWVSYTPTATAASGTFTATCTGRYKTMTGGNTEFSITVTTTSFSTPGTPLTVTLPGNADESFICHGMNQTTLKGFPGLISSGTDSILLWDEAAFPITANGQILIISGSYRRA